MANAIVCLVLAVLVMLLQLLGFTGTCTMGGDGSFVTGAIVSAAPLGIAFGSALRIKRVPAERTIALIAAAALTLLVVLTRDVWLNTLRFGSACGADGPNSGVNGAGVMILISYLFAPVLLIALLLPWRGFGRKPSIERPHA